MVASYRWVMTAPGVPLEKVSLELSSPGPGEGLPWRWQDVASAIRLPRLLYDGVRTSSALPLALGHEISGRVIAAGDDYQSLLGGAVIIPR